MSKQIDGVRKAEYPPATVRGLSDKIPAAGYGRTRGHSHMEQALCSTQFKLSDIDEGITLREGVCVTRIDPSNTERILPAGTFAAGTRERGKLIDVLARMSRVVLESQRDSGTELVERLLNAQDDETKSVSVPSPAEGFQSS
jgi:hypothetical protein